MTKVNVSELESAALDWAVAKSVERENYDGRVDSGPDGTEPWSPSTDWSQGGPLIEKYRAWMDTDIQHGDPEDAEWSGMCEALEGRQMFGTTPLIAAMRAIVAAEIGETVDVPKELLK